MIEIKDKENNVYYKNNPEYFDELLELYNTNIKGAAVALRYSKKYLLNWIYEVTKDKLAKNNNATRIFWIFHNITDYPKCANSNCQNRITSNVYRVSCGYNPYGKYDGLTRCCSITCLNKCEEHNKEIWQTYHFHKASDKDFLKKRNEKTKSTKKKLYGNENYVNVEKCKQTKMDRYGSSTYNNMDKNFATRYKHNGEGIYHSPESIEKMKKTSLENNGVEWSLASNEIREKGKLTRKLRYGDENYSNREKAKETSLLRYNEPHFTNRPKMLATKLEHFGCYCPESAKKKAEETFLKRTDGKYRSVLQMPEIRKLGHRSKYMLDGFVFDSSWEVAFYIWNRDIGNSIIRSPLQIPYVGIDEKNHFYTPDFSVNGELIEIKGCQFFKESKDGIVFINPYSQKSIHQERYAYFYKEVLLKHKVRIITSPEISKYIKYVRNQYGSNYVRSLRVSYQ